MGEDGLGGLGPKPRRPPLPLLQNARSRVKVEALGNLINAFVRVGLEQKRFGQG
jgi:hypothetical protein